MKVIMLMFDSLNRHYLPCYGKEDIDAPNFARLAEKTCTFDTSYVCSMPCMPARRDFHTGRPNFLHRSWGPLEPFDDSVPEMLKKAGIHTHLVTDHYHYFEDGGATYHNRYSTWDFFRGQEGDFWTPQIRPAGYPPNRFGRHAVPDDTYAQQDMKNRKRFDSVEHFPQGRCFDAGLNFLEMNAEEDNWLLQIETFDPHEPFHAHDRFRDFYKDRRLGDDTIFDWPLYRFVEESEEAMEHLRAEYSALLSMCDYHLGRILDHMDAHQMWEDTMLVVWTDHGFLLGEHNSAAKCWCPFYEEVAHTPFFVWDPRCGKKGERRKSLVQPSIDLGPTLLGYFGQEPTEAMTGRDLAAVVAKDEPVREYGLFGMHGNHVNLTDGRHVYMRGTDQQTGEELYEYTHMPTYMRGHIPLNQMQQLAELAEPFSFTKGCRTMKIPKKPGLPGRERVDMDLSTRLYDVVSDPKQERLVEDADLEAKLIAELRQLMEEVDTPPEQYHRIGIARE